MKLSEFKKRHYCITKEQTHTIRWYPNSSDKPIPISIPISFIKNLKEKTANINFGCDFDKTCWCHKETYEKVKKDPAAALYEKKACCYGCYNANGHFEQRYEYIQEEDLKTMASLFKHPHGYWSPDVGCKLPRSLRSAICTSFICYATLRSKKLKLSEEERKIIAALKNEQSLAYLYLCETEGIEYNPEALTILENGDYGTPDILASQLSTILTSKGGTKCVPSVNQNVLLQASV